MSKEKAEHEEHKEKKGGSEKKRKHLREIRSVMAHDGSIVHHHTYADSPDAKYSEPERGPMATSGTPADAGHHVEEMFGQNENAAPPEEAQQPQPDAAPQGEEEQEGE